MATVMAGLAVAMTKEGEERRVGRTTVGSVFSLGADPLGFLA